MISHKLPSNDASRQKSIFQNKIHSAFNGPTYERWQCIAPVFLCFDSSGLTVTVGRGTQTREQIFKETSKGILARGIRLGLLVTAIKRIQKNDFSLFSYKIWTRRRRRIAHGGRTGHPAIDTSDWVNDGPRKSNWTRTTLPPPPANGPLVSLMLLRWYSKDQFLKNYP